MDESKTELVQEKKKIDTGLLVGLAAIFISVATLVVYIYQARIMQNQQHASVWPYVEWYNSNVGGIYVEVKNKGIGPAIIKNATLRVDGKVIENIDDLFTEMIGEHSNMAFVTSYIGGRVMSPGESFKVFTVTDSAYLYKLDSAFNSRQFEMEICYCSIYNDCWISEGITVKEGACK
jgi:hypothetical protein